MTEIATGSVQDLTSTETLNGAVNRLTRAFAAAGLDTPALDARILVAEAAGVSRETLIADGGRSMGTEDAARLALFQSQRLARVPVSRIIGRRAFRGLELEVGPATLDPRADTETLVETALQLVGDAAAPGGEAPRILDLGTGTGAILIAILAELPQAHGLGVDISEEALAIARRNAARHDVAGRARFGRSDWLGDVNEVFDLVVSNPPYVASGQIAALEPEVARYDPRAALDGGEDGLAAYRAILRDVQRVLSPEGWLLLEVGADGADAVIALCRAQGLIPDETRPWLRRDLAGRPRCVAVRARR